MELRCDHKLHGHIDGDLIEVSCQSRFCGKRPGVVVIHRFDVNTGKLIETRRFSDPVNRIPEMGDRPRGSRDGINQSNDPLVKEKENGARSSVSIRYS